MSHPNTSIIVFAFNRPDHLGRTLHALAACPEAATSRVTIYCDGARRDSDAERVAQVRIVAGRDAALRAVCVDPDSRVPERRVVLAPVSE